MVLDREGQQEFERLVTPLIEFLAANCDVNDAILIRADAAEILQGATAFYTSDFIGG